MKFAPLPKEVIREFLDTSRSSWYVLTLTDGRSLPFEVEGPYVTYSGDEATEIPISRDALDALVPPGHLKSAVGEERSVFIPLDRIAGINTLSFEQQQIEMPAKGRNTGFVNEHAANILFRHLLEVADASGFPTVHRRAAYAPLRMDSRIEFTDVTFANETPLYSDWGYIQRNSGGINSIGVGIPFASLSAGWSKSLWSQFKKKIEGQEKAINDSCSGFEAVSSGFVTFLEEDRSDSSDQPLEQTGLSMEGARWVPAAVSDRRLESTEQLTEVSWSLTYFRADGFMFPLKLWERIGQPVRIFSEVVPVVVRVGGKEQRCYLKARAAAYVK